MTTCHQTCLTCSSPAFPTCLTCPTGLTLSLGTCNCDTPWQTECTGQSALRPAVMFLDLIIKCYIVGVMGLYLLRVKLPVGYRVWSGLCGLSLLVYNEIFYLQYEDELCLKALSVSNGPYFATFRVMAISTSHIFPTMTLLIIIAILFILLHYPILAFNTAYQSKIDYLKNQGLHFFDCTFFFASKMMFFFIGKFIKQSSSASLLYIIITSLYSLFALLAWSRLIYKYHQGTLEQHIYPTPIYLYTLLAPAAMIGLPLATSQVLLVIVYCSPFALLILILLLNRNMIIFNKPNLKFFGIELLMVGLTIAFIFLADPYRTYVLIGIFGISIVVVTAEVWVLYVDGFDLGLSKVYPVLDGEEQAPPKKIYGEENVKQNEKFGYF